MVPRETVFRTLEALALDAGVARALRTFMVGVTFVSAVLCLRPVRVTPAFGRVVV